MTNWLDRASLAIAPRWGLKRFRARVAAELLQRHYEAAAAGRRTQGWRRNASDPNAALAGGLHSLRDHARDLVRNNPYAESALSTIVDHVCGWGIVASPNKTTVTRASYNVAKSRWDAWAGTKACDADGRHDFVGLEKLVMRTVVEAGEVLVRRRWRLPIDNLPIPMQLQIIEPDFLDTSKDGLSLPNGGRIVQGVEFDAIGKRAAYWLFREHPGSAFVGSNFSASQRIPASEILHVFKPGRSGQVRAASWFAPVILRLKDFDEYEDAALMKQKIAACLAVITSDLDGTSPTLGGASTDKPEVDYLEPGMIVNAAAGRSVNVVQPPSVAEHSAYTTTVLRAIATGLGVAYEDLTGDYTNLPFSAARMSRLRHWARVHDWRWNMLIPQFCGPAWEWAMQAAAIVGLPETPAVEWTAPAMPMIEPDKEGLAYSRNIRAGITTLSETLRELGYDPETILTEMSKDWELVDRLGLILDSDPRKTTQAGLPREPSKGPGNGRPAATRAKTNGNGNGSNGNGRGHDPVAEAEARHAEWIRGFRAGRDAVTTQAALEVARASASQPPAPVSVDARTTVAPAAVSVDARTSVAPAEVNVAGPVVHVAPPSVTIAEGAVRAEIPVTVADTVHVPSGRKTIERDDKGRISAIVDEGTPTLIVTRDEQGRATGAEPAAEGELGA